MTAQYVQDSALYWSTLFSEPTVSDSLFLALALEGSLPHRTIKALMRQMLLMGTELQRTLAWNGDALTNLTTAQVETVARNSRALQVGAKARPPGVSFLFFSALSKPQTELSSRTHRTSELYCSTTRRCLKQPNAITAPPSLRLWPTLKACKAIQR